MHREYERSNALVKNISALCKTALTTHHSIGMHHSFDQLVAKKVKHANRKGCQNLYESAEIQVYFREETLSSQFYDLFPSPHL